MGCAMYYSDARLDGKTAIVTGCNTGIGKETVRDLVQRGCRVIMACRDVTKADAAATEIRQTTSGVAGVGTVVVVRLDLVSLESVRQCADQLLRSEPQINLLINNAGTGGCPKALSEDGIEFQFAVNHLGHFLLTLLLLPKLLISTPARIVNVSSINHRGGDIDFSDINMDIGYSAIRSYNRTKLCNVLFSKELARRLRGTGVSVYSLHPGLVATEVFRHLDALWFPGATWLIDHVVSWFMKTPLQGAQTTIFCAVAETIQDESGLYYSECKLEEPSRRAKDPELALQLWEVSLNMIGLQSYDISEVKK